MRNKLWTIMTLAIIGLLPQLASASVVMSFDNNNYTTNPFSTSLMDDQTSVSGTITDPDYNGGTDVTVTFYNPRIAVDVTTPSSPNFSASTLSYFGTETTGFGVGDATVGRFTRGETFTITATQSISLDSMTFHEYSGDEVLHISWVQNGVAVTNLFDFSTMGGSGAIPSDFTVPFGTILADANTDIVITNVSAVDANASGRLRFRDIEISVTPEPATMSLLCLGAAGMLLRRKRR